MPDNLQFDRAEPTPGAPGAPGMAGVLSCKACGALLRDSYFVVNGNIMCDNCRRAIAIEWDQAAAGGRMGKAVGLGVLAAAGCSALWYAVLKLTDSQWGILAVVVGLVVGGAVRKGSNGRGGWQYQALAIFLTYSAIVISFLPFALSGAQAAGRTLGVADIITLYALPFLMGFQNLIGLLIIGFALYEAWKLNRRVELKISGPHQVSAQGTRT